jgi:hypothetical protein
MMMNRQVGRYNVDLHSVMDQNTGNWVYMPIITDFGYAENQGREIDHKRFYINADSGVDVEQFLLNADNLAMMYSYPENHQFSLTKDYKLTAGKRTRLIRRAEQTDRFTKVLIEHLAVVMDDAEFLDVVDILAGANGEFAMAIDYAEHFVRDNFNAACAEHDLDCFDVLYSGVNLNSSSTDRFRIDEQRVTLISDEEFADELRVGSKLRLIAAECMKTFASLPKDLQDFIDDAREQTAG